MQWTTDTSIETPEQIDVSLEIAGLGSRFVAQLIDAIIKALLFIAVAAVAIWVIRQVIQFSELELLLGQYLLGILCYFFFLAFDIYFEVANNGQTPGKKFAGIRVIREGGAPVDFTGACVRNLVGMADFLPVFYMLGALLIQLSPRGQRLGDMAAGTIVIRERAVSLPADLEREVAGLVNGEFSFTSQQLAACSDGDRHILRSFLERHREMSPEACRQLAARLTATFLNKTAYQPAYPITDGSRAAAFLASLYRDLDRWAKQGS